MYRLICRNVQFYVMLSTVRKVSLISTRQHASHHSHALLCLCIKEGPNRETVPPNLALARATRSPCLPTTEDAFQRLGRECGREKKEGCAFCGALAENESVGEREKGSGGTVAIRASCATVSSTMHGAAAPTRHLPQNCHCLLGMNVKWPLDLSGGNGVNGAERT